MRAQGMKTPQLAFHTVAATGPRQVEQVRILYNKFYQNPKYDALWYRWQGKPLIIAKNDPALALAIRNAFTFRTSYWGGLNPNPGSWNTDGPYPMQVAKAIMRDAQGRPEQTGVSVASSISSPPSSDMGPGDGRSWFVDEFSKDTEPMWGGFGDDYYYQLVNSVRRYKGVRSVPPVHAKPVRLSGGFEPWQGIQPEYRDDIGDPLQRDFEGWNKSVHYTNATGRTDIQSAKVTYDAKNIYFYVHTVSR